MHKVDIFDESKYVLLMMKHFKFVEDAISKFIKKHIWILFGIPVFLKKLSNQREVQRVFNI